MHPPCMHPPGAMQLFIRLAQELSTDIAEAQRDRQGKRSAPRGQPREALANAHRKLLEPFEENGGSPPHQKNVSIRPYAELAR
mmetsp:Transcript_353/g.673  ORF Transcript_353/g.673 Transcript_353/m.673 type:complete len:83 (-) Transcript_353:167-415(-)